jgi:hypothetical protein
MTSNDNILGLVFLKFLRPCPQMFRATYTVLLKYCTELNNAGIAISMTRNVVGVWDLTSGQLNTLISKVGMHSFLSKSVYSK